MPGKDSSESFFLYSDQPEKYYLDRNLLKLPQGSMGDVRFPPDGRGQAGNSVPPGRVGATLSSRIILKVVCFGKVHFFTPAGFEKHAARLHKTLSREASILQDSIKSNLEIYNEWANPEGWIDGLTADSVEVVGGIRDWFTSVKEAKKPDAQVLVKLENNLLAIKKGKLNSAASSLEYNDLLEIGLDLQIVRIDEERFLRNVERFRNKQIDVASSTVQGLELVEGAAFQALGLVSTITMMDPLREVAYKIGLIIMRASARSAGALLAESSVSSQIWGVLKADVPPLIVNIAMKPLQPYFKAIKISKAGENFALFIIQQKIEFLCDLSILLVDTKGQPTEKQMVDLAFKRFVSAITQLLSFIMPTVSEKQRNTIAKNLIESTIITVSQDLAAAIKAGKEENRDFMDVFFAELPWTIVKIFQGMVLGVMGDHARKMNQMVKEHRGEDYRPASFTAGIKEDMDVLRSQRASSIFTGKINKDAYKGIVEPQYKPLPKPGKGEKERKEYIELMRRWAKENNLTPETAGPLLRYCEEAQYIITFRIPSKQMMELQGQFGMLPKPLAIKAKSAKGGPYPGRVVKPDSNQSTHPGKQAEAMVTYKKGLADMRKAGNVVLDDGLVIHPRMLRDLAENGVGGAGKANRLNRAAQVLESMDILGHESGHDLGMGAGQAKLREAIAKVPGASLEDVNSILNEYKHTLGYYPDLDLAEVIHAPTGKRIALGAGNEEGMDLEAARKHLEAVDSKINFLSGGLDDKGNPHPANIVQHGADYEFFKGTEWGTAGGEVVMALPHNFGRTDLNERFVKIPVPPDLLRKFNQETSQKGRETIETEINKQIRLKYEDHLKRLLGAETYQPYSGTQRALALQKDLKRFGVEEAKDGTLGKLVPPLTKSALTIIREVITGEDQHLQDTLGSFVYRNLSWDQKAVGDALGLYWQDVWNLEQDYGVIIAVDDSVSTNRNIVLTVHSGTKPVAEGVAQLAGIYQELQLNNKRDFKVWFEMYTSFRPAASDYVDGLLGEPFVPQGKHSIVKDLVPAFQPRVDKSLFAFKTPSVWDYDETLSKYYYALGDKTPFTPIYTPNAEMAPPSGEEQCLAHPPMRAPKLCALWEMHQNICELKEFAVQIDGHDIAILFISPYTTLRTNSFELQKIPGESMLVS